MWIDLIALWNWTEANPQLGAGLLILLISGVATATYRLYLHWRARPRLEFGLDHGDTPNDAIVTITNIGGRTAERVRVTWSSKAPLWVTYAPQPFPLGAGNARGITISTDSDGLLTLAAPEGLWGPPAGTRFGSLSITYRGLFRRRRTGCSIVRAQHTDPMMLVASIDLDKLPRREVQELFPLIGWLEAQLRIPQRRQRRTSERKEQEYRDRLERTRSILTESGIGASFDSESTEVGYALLDELERRGWQTSYHYGGMGVEVMTSNRSDTARSRLSGKTLADAAAFTLVAAIGWDEARQTTPRDPVASGPDLQQRRPYSNRGNEHHRSHDDGTK